VFYNTLGFFGKDYYMSMKCGAKSVELRFAEPHQQCSKPTHVSKKDFSHLEGAKQQDITHSTVVMDRTLFM